MRLIIVSNRLPVSVAIKNGKIQLTDSAGGVASGIQTYLNAFKASFPQAEYLWVGWPGTAVPEELQDQLTQKLLEKSLHPVFLREDQVENFYYGFCNNTIWPLFHSFPSYVNYDKEQWAAYREVNEVFGKILQGIVKPGDVVWVHDYHFMLLPKILREKVSDEIPVGFFLHIPFPFYEIYRLLPDKWRRSLLSGMLGADLVGFHTYDYTQYFLGCVQRILGYEHTMESVTLSTRKVRVDTFPIGIDFKKFNEGVLSTEVGQQRRELKNSVKEKKIILSIDRLDYTKGIDKRLLAYELFLEKNPKWQGKVVLQMVAVPSRTEVVKYQEMKKEIDELVGKINGRFGTVSWTPIIYQYKNLSPVELLALYSSSNVALVTPLRDGMNMIAKEYVASRRDQTGVLVLSEMAGAASEMGEAVIINPNHIEEISAALLEALEMPKEMQIERNQLMQNRLQRYDIARWGNDFIKELAAFKERQVKEREGKFLGANAKGQIIKDFSKASQRLLLLDYDGSLVPFEKYPPLAKPSQEVIAALGKLNDIPNTTVVIISGRDRITMERWLKSAGVSMSAEHGVWIKSNGKKWKMIKPLRGDWKEAVLPVMRAFVDRVPGSFLEEKEFCLVWHYRMANPEMANLRAKELTSNLINLTTNMNVQVMPGSKIVEIRTAGTDKGATALHFLEQQKYDFILAVGDDNTDEDMFKALPESAYTIKVRTGQTAAKYIVASPKDVLDILTQLGEKPRKKK
jgi:trehalose 6-phosphate synthase/phosphatase